MEFTFFNIILILGLILVSILFGCKIGYRKGRVDGLLKGKECERDYLFSKIPKEMCNKIVNEEYKRLMNLIYGEDNE